MATTYTPTTTGVLSEQDYIYCFRISGVIWDAVNTASINDGFGNQLSLTDINVLQADLRARLASLDTATVTELQNCISAWFPLRFSATEMDGGAVGDTTGLKYSPKSKRDTIAEYFSSITGCMSMATALMHKKKSMDGEKADDCVIGVRRG